MVLEDQLRHNGIQLEFRGKIYGEPGNIEKGALNDTAAQAIIAELARVGFPVEEINVVDQTLLVSEANPEYDYVVQAMLADWANAGEQA